MVNDAHAQPSHRLVVAALLAVQALFGLNYVISKIVVDAFPPLVWASFRIVVASAIMVLMAVVLKRPHPKGGRKFFVPLIGFALLGTVINQVCFLVGLHYTTPANSAILNTLIPVFTLLIVTMRGQEPLTARRATGFVFAFIGVLVLRNVEHLHLSDATFVGDMLTVVNCLSYALFLSFSRRFLQENDRIWTTAWLFMYGSVAITALAMPDWIGFTPPELTGGLLAAGIFAILGGTLLTYFLSNWALAHTSSSQVALFIYVQPVIAAIFAWAWLHQAITARMVVSSALIFLGVTLVLKRKAHA